MRYDAARHAPHARQPHGFVDVYVRNVCVRLVVHEPARLVDYPERVHARGHAGFQRQLRAVVPLRGDGVDVLGHREARRGSFGASTLLLDPRERLDSM